MLKSLDILIGLSVVMLIVSMAVTLLNQTILNAFARRGRCLQQGIADLLQHLDWKMPRKTAEDVAALVLTQPSIGKSKVGALAALFPSLQFGEVIHREELTKILLDFGSRSAEIKNCLAALSTAINANNRQNIGAEASALICAVQSVTGAQGETVKDIVKVLEEIVATKVVGRQQLAFNRVAELLQDILAPLERVVASLEVNGIADPAKTLDNVRMMALQMEKSNPEQANDLRHSNALLQEAASPFLAKINFAFDQTMDRVSERFTYNARVVTFISAAIVAVALQMDTVYIFNRFSMDDKMRDAFVKEAISISMDEELKKLGQNDAAQLNLPGKSTPVAATLSGAASGTAPVKADSATDEKLSSHGSAKGDTQIDPDKEKQYLNFLFTQGVIRTPSPKNWVRQWGNVNPVGILLSILLLSLGAPFWYKAIGQLLQFRSILAQKDDSQRTTRQTNQPPDASPKPGTPTAASQSVIGERGDLNAV